MNYRTLTDNPQATELIAAVKDLKPVKQQDKYQGSMEYIAADNASYAALIAQHKTMQEPPKEYRYPEIPGEFVALSAFLTGLLFTFALVYQFIRDYLKSKK